MKTIGLLLVLISTCCFAVEKSTSELMAYDFNACVDVHFSKIGSIPHNIRIDDPYLMKAREHLGSPANSNMIVGYDGVLTAGRYDPNYRIYCIEQLDQKDSARRLQVICHQDAHQKAVKIIYKPISEFDGQNTFQCVTNCDRAPFKNIYEMIFNEDEVHDLIPQQGKEIERFRKCAVTL